MPADGSRESKPCTLPRRTLAMLVAALASGGCSAQLTSFEPSEHDAPRALEATAALEDTCDLADAGGGKLMALSGQWTELAQSNDRIVAASLSSWTLWDRASGRTIAQGTRSVSGRIDLAGETLLTPSENALEVRSAQDGSLRTKIPVSSTFVTGLSADGRHVFAVEQGQLRVWDTAGSLRATSPTGDLSAQSIRGSAAVLQVAPRWSGRIETLTFATGEVRASAKEYAGGFFGWFVDGRHFTTRVPDPADGATLRIYDAESTLVWSLPIRANARVGGDNGYLWVESPSGVGSSATSVTRVYRLGVDKPVLTFDGPSLQARGRTMMSAFTGPDNTFKFLDLRGSEPSLRVQPYGGGAPQEPQIDADGRVVFINQNVAYDGTRLDARGLALGLGCGTRLAEAGAEDKVALATTDRVVRIYALHAGKAQLRAKIPGILARQVKLSADGRLLLVQGVKDAPRSTVELYAYELDPSGRPLRELAIPRFSVPGASVSFSSSADGSRLALEECRGSGYNSCRTYVVEAGLRRFETPEYNGSSAVGALLSPSGRRLATRAGEQTTVYNELVLETTLPGRPLLWLDEDRLVVQTVKPVGTQIVDLTGKISVTLPTLPSDLRRVGRACFHDTSNVYSATDGRLLWKTRDAGERAGWFALLAVAGDSFVYIVDDTYRFAKLPLVEQCGLETQGSSDTHD